MGGNTLMDSNMRRSIILDNYQRIEVKDETYLEEYPILETQAVF